MPVVHRIAAMLGLRGYHPLRLRRQGRIWVIEVDGRKIAVPARQRWRKYRRGMQTRFDALVTRYGLAQAPIEPGQTVIDIGANVGEVALWAAERGARVIAIEPDPLVYECLEFNTAGIDAITPVRALLWHESAELTLNLSSQDADSSVFTPDSGINAGTVTMQARPLDDVLAPFGLDRIDLIKCDAEGAEPEVLDGARQALAKTRFIAIDTSPEREGESTAGACAERLAAAGFAVSHREGTTAMTFGRRPPAPV